MHMMASLFVAWWFLAQQYPAPTDGAIVFDTSPASVEVAPDPLDDARELDWPHFQKVLNEECAKRRPQSMSLDSADQRVAVGFGESDAYASNYPAWKALGPLLKRCDISLPDEFRE